MRQAEDTARARDASTGRSDAELLVACRNGDVDAWDTLVKRYERLIFTVAVRNGLSREDAADVAQTTFVALLDSIGRLRTDESLPYWLMTVARRQSWRLRTRAAAEVPRSGIAVDHVDPIPEYERIAAVHEALAQLDEPCRELLTAMYFDPNEPSYVEIAGRLSRPVGSLGPMRGRCLEKLRAIMDEDAIA